MYLNYLEDRKALGYQCLIDIECGGKTIRVFNVIILGFLFQFGYIKPAEAMGTNFSPQEMVTKISYRDTSGLIKPSNIRINSIFLRINKQGFELV